METWNVGCSVGRWLKHDKSRRHSERKRERGLSKWKWIPHFLQANYKPGPTLKRFIDEHSIESKNVRIHADFTDISSWTPKKTLQPGQGWAEVRIMNALAQGSLGPDSIDMNVGPKVGLKTDFSSSSTEVSPNLCPKTCPRLECQLKHPPEV